MSAEYAVVLHTLVVFQLAATITQADGPERDAFLLRNLLLETADGVGKLYIQSYCLAGQGLDKDLHTRLRRPVLRGAARRGKSQPPFGVPFPTWTGPLSLSNRGFLGLAAGGPRHGRPVLQGTLTSIPHLDESL